MIYLRIFFMVVFVIQRIHNFMEKLLKGEEEHLDIWTVFNYSAFLFLDIFADALTILAKWAIRKAEEKADKRQKK